METKKNMSKVYTLGVDIGSTSSKCVIMSDGKTIESSAIIAKGAGTDGIDIVVKEALKKMNLKFEDSAAIVSTGYGRNSYERADKTMSELSCHAKGGHYIFGEIRTIIDIGGQDSKVLKLDASGQLQNFVMNDKCAAGTGRFLEVISRNAGIVRALEKELDTKIEVSSQSQLAGAIGAAIYAYEYYLKNQK